MKNKVVSYKVSLMNNATKMQGVLDEQNEAGWRLISTLPNSNGGYFLFFEQE
ncbi:MAG: hypothetical protein OSA78_06955 [Flavobacteriales bacterium]|jgi:hypothetical protein|nr:hypothetical protein [Flavobacteriales bacterium]MDE0979714.1 hypothetical protein [Flavobacteriales bacterium]|tara:strand:+ start:713 stop:868 length:156 start_codon:yes stop_codon:yes gene_type:complete